MLRILLAVAGLLALAPVTASASPFGELPFQPLSGSGACLQATGAPGELVRQTETTAQFFTAAPTGLTAAAVLPTDGALDCADVGAWPGGGGLLAFGVGSQIDDEYWFRGFLREPGQAWGEPIEILPPETRLNALSSTLATSPRGDALVASSSIDATGRVNVRLARRLPGGAFGAPERLFISKTRDDDAADLHAGYSASGEAVVIWSVQGPKEDDPYALWAATASPGAPFGAPQKVAAIERGAPTTLAVGADGRAIAIFTDGDRRLVATERAPGSAFTAPSIVDKSLTDMSAFPAAVVRPDGGAVIAWWSPLTAALTVRARERPGAFGPPIALAPARRLDQAASVIQQSFSPALSSQTKAARPRATLTPDGRVLITWSDLARRQGVWRIVPGVALVNFAGGAREASALGGAVRSADAQTPLLLADGSSAVAWTDSGQEGLFGRLHLAREGAQNAPEPTAPAVTVAAVGSRVLKDRDPLRLRVTCSAACDIYAHIAGEEEIRDAISLPAAGSRRLLLQPGDHPLAPRGGGKVRIVVRSSAPGAHRATARTLTLDLRRARTAYAPRVLGLNVTLDGKDLVVRWHTAKPANPRYYFVWAFDGEDPVASRTPGGTSRRNFTVRIRNARGASKVTVYAAALHEDKVRKTSVKVPA